MGKKGRFCFGIFFLQSQTDIQSQIDIQSKRDVQSQTDIQSKMDVQSQIDIESSLFHLDRKKRSERRIFAAFGEWTFRQCVCRVVINAGLNKGNYGMLMR